jgi:hypothetical protein
VVAGVPAVNGTDFPADLVRNFLQNVFLKKLLPLPRNNAVAGRFFGVGGAGLDSDDEKSWQVDVSNGSLLKTVVGRSLETSLVVRRWPRALAAQNSATANTINQAFLGVLGGEKILANDGS